MNDAATESYKRDDAGLIRLGGLPIDLHCLLPQIVFVV